MKLKKITRKSLLYKTALIVINLWLLWSNYQLTKNLEQTDKFISFLEKIVKETRDELEKLKPYIDTSEVRYYEPKDNEVG